jgi:ubiquinone/menaquinone biosynthesis C-methylase UbiE
MQMTVIKQQYNNLIAHHYDLDPLNLTAASQDCAIGQLFSADYFASRHGARIDVLDLGMGTGTFLEKVMASADDVRPYGIDLSDSMAQIACERLPQLQFRIGDAADFDQHFPDQQFDLISTHFITGFVATEHLAPLIAKRLKPGGVWSFVGSSQAAYPVLRMYANNRFLRMLLGGASTSMDNLLCPQDEQHLRNMMRDVGLEVLASDTKTPRLKFENFAEFMEFAYDGGWLTPYIEDLGLHKAGRATRAVLNELIFPMSDQHNILHGLARKSSTV